MERQPRRRDRVRMAWQAIAHCLHVDHQPIMRDHYASRAAGASACELDESRTCCVDGVLNGDAAGVIKRQAREPAEFRQLRARAHAQRHTAPKTKIIFTSRGGRACPPPPSKLPPHGRSKLI